MFSPCTKEVTGACCHGCCLNPLLGHLELHVDHHLAPKSPSTTAIARHEFRVTTTSCLFPHTQFTNHESLPSLHQSFSEFTKVFPRYSQTDQADEIRSREYFHLSLSNHVCFDYIGHGIFSYTQLHSHCSTSSVACTSSFPPLSLQLEPPFFDISYKSVTLTSQMRYEGEESELQSRVRKRIMAFLNISEDDYTMIFTANQSSAFKLLAESYPFYSNRNLLTVYDHENEAVQMMIESSKKRGARVKSAEFSWPNLRIQSEKLMKKLAGKRTKRKSGLFVFPLQSKVTGARYSYQWMNVAHEKGWHVLLDASALGPKDMDTLGLSLFNPDFLICSFYKIFGENLQGSDVCLSRKSSASVLEDSTATASIGIVNLVPAKRLSQFAQASSITDKETELESNLKLHKDDIAIPDSFSSPISTQQTSIETSEESKEHEAKNFYPRRKDKLPLSEIMELEAPHESILSKFKENSIDENTKLECKGLDHADSLGLILISHRLRYLINWLVNALMSLQHPYSEDRLPLVRIYGPKVMFDRGPAVAFNIFDWNGEKVDPALVQKLADRYNISLSYGLLQHIWFSNKYAEEMQRTLESKTNAREETTLNDKGGSRTTCSGISVVTAAMGFLTNFEDIYRLWAFVSRFLDADFVEKERWRYLALNQRTIEF